MKYLSILLIIFQALTIDAKLEDHFKKPMNKSVPRVLEGIDFIYMINLDQRPEKFERSMHELASFGIEPYRFSAVNGWELTLEAVRDIGVKYRKPMSLGKNLATYYERKKWKRPAHERPLKRGRTYFCHCMSLGAIGICLSHLSVLQDAFDSGYETIWVMEDDIEVIRSPHLLPDLIHKLDEAVGKDGWDILFTDQDTKGQDGKYVPCFSFAMRLNFTPSHEERFAKRYDVTPEIRSVGARYGAYSMIVRRSGMKKLLDYFKKYNLFLPYDMDYVMPDDIRVFSLIDDVVSTRPNALSDNARPNYK
jgi:GR25 family glycosyltransferase involved in LPS biosynthesis